MCNHMILVLMFKNANNPRLPAKARWMGLNIAAKKSIAKSVAEITLPGGFEDALPGAGINIIREAPNSRRCV